MKRIGTVLLAAGVLLTLSLTALAGGYEEDEKCEKYPWKCETTTTSTTVYETTTTTEPTTTTVGETTTTTAQSTTTSSIPSTTVGDRPAEWSWSVECGSTLFVDFGEGIEWVDLAYYGEVFYRFHRPGVYAVLIQEPTHVTLTPRVFDGFFPVPETVELTVEPCAVVPPDSPEPTLTIPGEPPVEPANPTGPVETLPFTGPSEDARLLAVLAGVFGLSGVGLLAWKGHSE